MYSGDKVFYAVQVTLQEAYDILIAYANKHQITLDNTFRDNIFHDNRTFYITKFKCYEKLYDKFSILENIISQLKLQHINILIPSCCNFHEYNSNVYLGVELGKNDIAYRDSVRSYDNFDEYYNSYIEGVVKMKKTFDNNKVLIEEELKKIDCQYTPKIYTMTNDCERCT